MLSHDQGRRFSAAKFAKFCGAICEIPRRYYLQIPVPYIPWPDGVVHNTILQYGNDSFVKILYLN